jgi:hypothetical protein
MMFKTRLYRNLLFTTPLIIILVLGFQIKSIVGIKSIYNKVPNLHYCEINSGKILQNMETEDGPVSGAPTKKNFTAAAAKNVTAAAAAAASTGAAPNLPADDAARIIAENAAAAAAARADLLKRPPPPPPPAQYKRTQSILRQRSVVN